MSRPTAELVHRWRVFETAIALGINGAWDAFLDWGRELSDDESQRMVRGLQEAQVERMEEAHAGA